MDYSSFRDWASLPAHIVEMMVIKLDRLSDYVRFCGVCSPWRYAALDANVNYKDKLNILKVSRKRLPMLLFRTDENNDQVRGLYSMSDKITYGFRLPLPYKYRFAGSSRGWLLCLENTMVVTLVNPLIDACITLPIFKDPIKLFKEEWHKRHFHFYITKGLLLSDPHVCANGFGVVVIYGVSSKLAFLKYGDPSWTFINSPEEVCDIIFYKGKLYGVDWWGVFFEIDIDSRTSKTIISERGKCASYVYLVESQAGDLLMVKRHWFQPPQRNYDQQEEMEDSEDENYNDDDLENFDSGSEPSVGEDESSDNQESCDLGDEDFPKSCEFKVFKMTHPTKETSATWIEINDIGQQALCVGDNSVSVSTIGFADYRPNSIYYTSHHHSWTFPYNYRGNNEDSGIFDLESKEFHLHHVLDSSRKYMQPPIWFVPNPQEKVDKV